MLCETPSSVLRDWTEDDAPFLARHADNPSIAGHMRDAFPRPYTIKDAEAYIAMATHNRSALLLAIEVDGEAVGGVGIHPHYDVYRRTAEIGYWLSEEDWGIATDAVRAIVPRAFDLFPIIRSGRDLREQHGINVGTGEVRLPPRSSPQVGDHEGRRHHGWVPLCSCEVSKGVRKDWPPVLSNRTRARF